MDNKRSKLYFLLTEEIYHNNNNNIIENDSKVQILLKKINLYLKKEYTGKYRFDLCSEEKGFVPDKLKLSLKKKRKIKAKWLQFNSDLSEIQRGYEKNLQKDREKK